LGFRVYVMFGRYTAVLRVFWWFCWLFWVDYGLGFKGLLFVAIPFVCFCIGMVRCFGIVGLVCACLVVACVLFGYVLFLFGLVW